MPKKKIKDSEVLEGAVQDLLWKYRERAKDKGREFSLTYNQFKELIFSPCRYCGVAAEESIKTTYINLYEYCRNTVDRVDNEKGYTLENSVPACWKCNGDKSDLSVVEWLQWIHKIAANTQDFPGLKEAAPLNHRKLTGHLQLKNARMNFRIKSGRWF